MNPAVIFLFYLMVMICPMLTLHPVILGISYCMAASYVGRLLGGKALKKSLLGWIPIALILVLANMLSVHNGETILFFLNGNPITMEAGIRGLLMSVSLWTILLWGLTMQRVITQDQLIWLFGKWAPRLGLTIGMILHYIPELHRKYRSVHTAELAMGHEGETGLSRKLQSVKEFSTVVSWSLEDSIETGDASNSCNVKEEIPILVDEIFRLRDNVCKIWTKHELWTTLRTDGKSYPPFVSSMEDYKEINALKQISNDEASYGSFAGALHRVYYEGSKKSMNLPKGFGPWERYWFPGESVSEFAMMVNVNRHMFLHREYEHRENISMSDEDFLKIINKGKRPETPKDFMLMQYHLLQKCKEELHRMLDFLFEEVKK